MKIISFVVKLHCEHCDGTGRVPGGQREYGELVGCLYCKGYGTVAGEVPFEDFAKLIQGIAK